MQYYRLNVFTFRMTYVPDICVLRDLKFSHSQFYAAELKWLNFTAINQKKAAPKVVSFFCNFFF